jgi:hypothetical protein
MLSIAEIKRGLFSYDEVSGGFVASLKTPADLLKAAKQVKAANVKLFDCFTPCPIHGLDAAMGLHRSWIPVLTFVGGIMAAILSLSPISRLSMFSTGRSCFGGKPYFSWPAYIPFLFEMTIYFAAVFTVVAVLVLGRLGFINRKVPAAGVTSDVFAIWIGDKGILEAM